MRQSLSMLTAMLVIAVAAAACSAASGVSAGSPPDRDPDIQGTVTRSYKADESTEPDTSVPAKDPEEPVSSDDEQPAGGAAKGTLGTILVEENPDEDTGSNKATVTVTDKTRIVRQEGESLVEATFDDLRNGLEVEVWFTGPVAESYPVQAAADVIVISR